MIGVMFVCMPTQRVRYFVDEYYFGCVLIDLVADSYAERTVFHDVAFAVFVAWPLGSPNT